MLRTPVTTRLLLAAIFLALVVTMVAIAFTAATALFGHDLPPTRVITVPKSQEPLFADSACGRCCCAMKRKECSHVCKERERVKNIGDAGVLVNHMCSDLCLLKKHVDADVIH